MLTDASGNVCFICACSSESVLTSKILKADERCIAEIPHEEEGGIMSQDCHDVNSENQAEMKSTGNSRTVPRPIIPMFPGILSRSWDLRWSSERRDQSLRKHVTIHRKKQMRLIRCDVDGRGIRRSPCGELVQLPSYME